MRISDWSSDVCASDLVSASANRLCNGCAVLHCVAAPKARMRRYRKHKGVQTRFAALAGDPRKGRGWRGLTKPGDPAMTLHNPFLHPFDAAPHQPPSPTAHLHAQLHM